MKQKVTDRELREPLITGPNATHSISPSHHRIPPSPHSSIVIPPLLVLCLFVDVSLLWLDLLAGSGTFASVPVHCAPVRPALIVDGCAS